MRMNFRPLEFDNCHQITKQTDLNFIFLIQRAVLLGLKEAGRLNEMQHRQAEAALLEWHRGYIRERAQTLRND